MRMFCALILFCVCCSPRSHAQLCSGSLGDPVVNITFGAGPNPGPALTKTNYTYSFNDCPPDGLYNLRNSSIDCFGSTWYTLPEDHTPNDVNGYFMLINASIQPGDFYVDTVKGLCENTTYEFAAWVVNVLKIFACNGAGINPKLTFRIETVTGTVLGTSTTGNIPQSGAATWKQYGLFFTTPATVSNVVIRITNDAPGGCGNDLALDDITFRPCGPTVSAALTSGNGGTNLKFCERNTSPFTIQANVSPGYSNPAYQWQKSVDEGISWTDISGETGLTYGTSLVNVGHVLYRLAVAEAGNIGSARCRTVSNQISVSVNALPVPGATSNGPLCDKDVALLKATGGGTYAWTGPAGFTSTVAQPTFTAGLSNAGVYQVVVTSDSGCVTTGFTTLPVNPNPTADAGSPQSICEGTSVVLQGSGGVKYSWAPSSSLSSPLAPNPIATPVDTTLYVLTVSDANNCRNRDSVLVNVWKKPRVNAGPDKKITAGQTVVLDGSVSGTAVQFTWQPSASLSSLSVLSPVANPTKDQTYFLTATSTLGCGNATDAVFVRVFEKVTVPNAFSPNADGINDIWLIDALETYPESTTSVFNRYGQVVFSSNGYSRPWDGKFGGKPVAAGTYYYVIDLKNGFEPLKGWVFVVR